MAAKSFSLANPFPHGRRKGPAGPLLTGRRVLFILVGFFGLVVAMNAAFVWLAVGSFSGVTSSTAYVEGLAYNRTLEAAEAQRARGWHGGLAYRDGGVELILAGADGHAVSGLELTLTVGRPATRAYDSVQPLSEIEPGRYRATLALAPGQWLARVEGQAADGTPFRTEERLWLP